MTEEGRKREGGCEGVGKPASEREKVREKGGGRKSESASERTKEKEREREQVGERHVCKSWPLTNRLPVFLANSLQCEVAAGRLRSCGHQTL